MVIPSVPPRTIFKGSSTLYCAATGWVSRHHPSPTPITESCRNSITSILSGFQPTGMLRNGRYHESPERISLRLNDSKPFNILIPIPTIHSVLHVPNVVPLLSTRLGEDLGWFTTDSTWPQIAGMMIPLYPIMMNGKTESPVIALAYDGLLRSNVDRLSFQPSLTTMPIGQFYELAIP